MGQGSMSAFIANICMFGRYPAHHNIAKKNGVWERDEQILMSQYAGAMLDLQSKNYYENAKLSSILVSLQILEIILADVQDQDHNTKMILLVICQQTPSYPAHWFVHVFCAHNLRRSNLLVISLLTLGYQICTIAHSEKQALPFGQSNDIRLQEKKSRSTFT